MHALTNSYPHMTLSSPTYPPQRTATKRMSGQWSRQATATLIELYRQHPCLYDSASDGYNCRSVRHDALDNILAGVLPLKPDTSLADIRQRVNVLRTQFSIEYRRCQGNPDQSAGTYSTVNLWCFNDLYFLRDHIGPCKRLRGPDSAKPETRGHRSSSPDRSVDVGEIETSPAARSNSTFDSDDPDFSCSLSGSKRRLHDAIDSEFMRKTGEALTAIQNELAACAGRSATAAHVDDKWDVFGKFVASELRALEQEHLQTELKKKIMMDIMGFQ